MKFTISKGKRRFLIFFLAIVALICSSIAVVRIRDSQMLCDAIKSNNHSQLVNLLENGAHTDSATHTALFFPVSVMLDSEFSTTPLITACKLGNTTAAELLLEHGANPNRRILGDFPCFGAIYSTPDGRSARFEIVPLLVSHGGNVELTGHGASADHVAFLEAEFATNETAAQSIALIQLVTNDPSNLTNGYGTTLLGVVGSTDLALWLIDSGADVDASDKYGLTPLMRAVIRDDIEMVELLLKYGADTDIRNNDGETAEDIAKKKGHMDVAELLAEYAG